MHSFKSHSYGGGWGARGAYIQIMCASDLYDTWSELTPLKDKETERDKTVIKRDDLQTKQYGKEETWPWRGDRARRQNEETQRWEDREIKGLPDLTEDGAMRKRGPHKADKQSRVLFVHHIKKFSSSKKSPKVCSSYIKTYISRFKLLRNGKHRPPLVSVHGPNVQTQVKKFTTNMILILKIKL